MTPGSEADEKLSEHFKSEELACRCGCGLLPGQQFINRLEILRVTYDHPMVITSGARCVDYNGKVATSGPAGPHVITPDRASNGEGAVDVLVHGTDAFRLIQAAITTGMWYGIGVNQKGPLHERYIHLDTVWNSPSVPRPRIWSY